MLLPLIHLCSWLLFSLLHPFHVSVCELEYDQKSEALEISHRIFLDDLEITLRNYSGNEKLDIMNPADPEALHTILKAYVEEHFFVWVNEEKVAINYLGEEREEDVMWCYVEVPGVTDLQVLDVENKMLMETYDDQINLVHVKAFGKVKTLKLYQFNEWGMLDIQALKSN